MSPSFLTPLATFMDMSMTRRLQPIHGPNHFDSDCRFLHIDRIVNSLPLTVYLISSTHGYGYKRYNLQDHCLPLARSIGGLAFKLREGLVGIVLVHFNFSVLGGSERGGRMTSSPHLRSFLPSLPIPLISPETNFLPSFVGRSVGTVTSAVVQLLHFVRNPRAILHNGPFGI